MSDSNKRVIDLRSDTVTKPTASMRAAMEAAEVGDDVYGEDPSVNQLEAMVAEMLGMEAAVFVASGTMGNLISVLSHCGRGDEMILGDYAHIFRAEQGGGHRHWVVCILTRCVINPTVLWIWRMWPRPFVRMTNIILLRA